MPIKNQIPLPRLQVTETTVNAETTSVAAETTSIKAETTIVNAETTSAPSGNYDWIKTEFEETLTMSTYLVAIVVAHYSCRTNTINLKDGPIK